MPNEFLTFRPLEDEQVMDTLIIPTFTRTCATRDNEIIGSYVEHDPADPHWPDGCETHEYVLAHVPKIVTLTYNEIIKYLRGDTALHMSLEASEKLRTRVESDTRFSEYDLVITPLDIFSAFVTLDRKIK